MARDWNRGYTLVGTGMVPPGYEEVAEWYLRSDSPDGLNRANGNYPRTGEVIGQSVPVPAHVQQKFQQLMQQGIIRKVGPTMEEPAPVAPTPVAPAPPAPAATPLPTPPSTIPTVTPPAAAPLVLDWTGLNQLPPMAQGALGRVPGTPEGTLPTVEMRKLLLDALKTDEQARLARAEFEEAKRVGDITRAQQKERDAAELAFKARELEQQASQFAQTFGLQAEMAGFQRDLALRQQAFEEEKYGTALAAKPENLIESALFQGGRRPGGVGTPASGMQPGTPAVSGTPGTSGVDAFAGAGGAAGIGSGRYASSTINPGDGTPYGERVVPWAATLEALRTRTHIPQAGMSGASGGLVTLNQLQNDPTLRINIGDYDQASLQNMQTPERGYLMSTLQAQGQDIAAFDENLRRSRSNQSTLGLTRTF